MDRRYLDLVSTEREVSIAELEERRRVDVGKDGFSAGIASSTMPKKDSTRPGV